MPDPEKDKDAPVIRPFAAFLQDHNGGRTTAELADKLHELVGDIRLTGKKGALTLTLAIEPMKGDADTLVVTADVTVKAPKPERKGAVFFSDDDGNLVRHDPRQQSLPLKGLPGSEEQGPLKDVAQ